MKKVWLWALVGVLLAVVACAKDPVSTNRTNNPDVSVELLFENDGCKVYRFYDSGEYRYYASCGRTTTVMTTHQEGKVSVPENTPTVEECK